jgi:hypothetical protein
MRQFLPKLFSILVIYLLNCCVKLWKRAVAGPGTTKPDVLEMVNVSRGLLLYNISQKTTTKLAAVLATRLLL